MAKDCHEETIGFETLWSGKVRITPELLEAAVGVGDDAKKKYLVAEARIGCSQRSGRHSVSAELEVKRENGKDVEYVLARSNLNPSALALGHRLKS